MPDAVEEDKRENLPVITAPTSDRIAAAGWLALALGSGVRHGRGALESWHDADEHSRRDSDVALLRRLYRQPAADEDSRPAPHPPAPEPTRYRPAAARVRGPFQGGES